MSNYFDLSQGSNSKGETLTTVVTILYLQSSKKYKPLELALESLE
jgi:hypothetical protein